MPKIPLNTIQSLTNEQTFLDRINQNFDTISEKAETFLSLDGALPNSMQADLDMNDNQILNLPPPILATDVVRLVDLLDVVGGTGLGSAFAALEARVTDTEAGLVAQSTAISSLQVDVTQNETGITSNSTAITALTSRVTDAENNITGNATAISTLDTRVTNNEGDITANASDITALTTSLATTNGNVSALSTTVSTLSSTVSSQGTTITSQGSAITALDSRVDIAEIDIDGNTTAISGNASAITALDTRVDATEAGIIANASAITALDTTIDDTTANTLFRMTAASTPEDAKAAIDMQVRATVGDDWTSAGLQLVAYETAGVDTSQIRLTADTTQIGQPGTTGGDFINVFEVSTVDGQPAVTINGKLYRDNVINTEMIQEGASTTVITLEDSDQTRTYNAWNNAGNGEEFSTINFALDGDGIVLVKLRCIITNASTFANDTGHFIQIVDGSAAEVFRIDIPVTLGFAASGYLPPIEFATSALPAGSNTLVAKLRINDTGVGGADSATVLKIGWFITEHHKPAIQAGGAAAAAVTYHSTQTNTSANDPTFSAVSIGTAATNRRVILGVGYSSSLNNVNSITIGGIPATKISHRRPVNTPIVSQLWVATVPTGTTADIVLSTSGGGVSDLAVSVFSVTTAAQAYVDVTSNSSASGTSPIALTDHEIQSGGAVIAFAYARNRNTFALSWTGANSVTENVEAAIGSSGNRYGAYSFLTTESTTDDDFSFTHASVTTPAYAAICAASFR